MNEEKAREIAIRVLDEFEELLAEKGIMVPSDDREGREEEACLYGCEYYELEDAIVDILVEETSEAQGQTVADDEAREACERMREKMAGAPAGWIEKASEGRFPFKAKREPSTEDSLHRT